MGGSIGHACERLLGSDEFPYVVCKGNHADGLPDTQEDSWSYASVEAFDAVFLVDVCEGVADG